MANGTGSGAVQPNGGTPTPTQTNQAYGQYHLHHYDGNVQNVNQPALGTRRTERELPGRAASGPV